MRSRRGRCWLRRRRFCAPHAHGSWMWKAERWTGCAMRWRRFLRCRRWRGRCGRNAWPHPRRKNKNAPRMGHPRLYWRASMVNLIAQAVKAFGFNTPLAPVFDLGLPESKKVMGTRCAGATAAEVVAYARPFLAGLAAHGVAGCGKHFPGLGGGTLDSHLETPKIRRTWQQTVAGGSGALPRAARMRCRW